MSLDMLEKAKTGYCFHCPECGYQSFIDDQTLPWEEGDELVITCEECGQEYTIRPSYEFKGFTIS